MSIKPTKMIVDNAVLYTSSTGFDFDDIDAIVAACTDTNRLGLGKDKIKFTATPSIVQYDFAGRKDKPVKEMQEDPRLLYKVLTMEITYNKDNVVQILLFHLSTNHVDQ